MRFGVILPIQSKDAGLDVLWDELREEVAVAEEAGFDAVFMTEFHQARGGAFVSPLLLGAGLLQGTTRIRFGTAVLATPLHHPVPNPLGSSSPKNSLIRCSSIRLPTVVSQAGNYCNSGRDTRLDAISGICVQSRPGPTRWMYE